LNWADDDCIDIFPVVLQPQVVSKWTTIVNGAPVGATFHDLEQDFMASFVTEPDAFLSLQTYMRTVRLTRSSTVSQFFDRIQHVCELASLLPQANGMELMTEQDQLLTAFNGCPTKWQAEHYKQHRSLHTKTFNTLKEFMIRMENIDQMLSKNHQSDSTQTKNNNSKRSNCKHSNRQNTSNTQGERKKIQPDDPCPFPGHESHKWGACQTYNPDAPGYRGPPSNQNNSRQGQGQSNRFQNQQGNRGGYNNNNNGSNNNNQNNNQGQQQRGNSYAVNQSNGDNHTSEQLGNNNPREAHTIQMISQLTAVPRLESFYFDASQEDAYDSDDTVASEESNPSVFQPDEESVCSAPGLITYESDSDDSSTSDDDSYQGGSPARVFTSTEHDVPFNKVTDTPLGETPDWSNLQVKSPTTQASITELGGSRVNKKLLLSLLDSGASHCLIN
jgi:hypothetical protein